MGVTRKEWAKGIMCGEIQPCQCLFITHSFLQAREYYVCCNQGSNNSCTIISFALGHTNFVFLIDPKKSVQNRYPSLTRQFAAGEQTGSLVTCSGQTNYLTSVVN